MAVIAAPPNQARYKALQCANWPVDYGSLYRSHPNAGMLGARYEANGIA